MVVPNREEAREIVAKVMGRKSHVNHKCKLCGKTFLGPSQQRFCGKKCLGRSRQSGVMSTCRNPNCRESYATGQGEMGFCSSECYSRDVPRRMEALEKKRIREALSRGSLVVFPLTKLILSSTYGEFINRVVSIMAKYEETVPYKRGATSTEIGELIGLRLGECESSIAPMMERFEAETRFFERVKHQSGLPAWCLTEEGRRLVTDGK